MGTGYGTSRVEKLIVFIFLRVSNPGMVQIFSTKTAQTGSVAHPASYSMSTGTV
jgi:hypothetical protein